MILILNRKHCLGPRPHETAWNNIGHGELGRALPGKRRFVLRPRPKQISFRFLPFTLWIGDRIQSRLGYHSAPNLIEKCKNINSHTPVSSAMFEIKAERIAPVMLECCNVRIRARAGETAFLARARKRQVPMTYGVASTEKERWRGKDYEEVVLLLLLRSSFGHKSVAAVVLRRTISLSLPPVLILVVCLAQRVCCLAALIFLYRGEKISLQNIDKHYPGRARQNS